ncbi:transcriptional repressor NF-X1 [Aplysia californica]|uniref:Transcriptional repressor NF-X1 n=1 Tax=Aplysia californica TaxID=6500 RepID=A0ABM1AFQ4_APLCA|nr:transcriptional repressor NF-X1 [Aplysia californica]
MSWQEQYSTPTFQPVTVPGMRASDLEAQMYYNSSQGYYPSVPGPMYHNGQSAVFTNTGYYPQAVPVDGFHQGYSEVYVPQGFRSTNSYGTQSSNYNVPDMQMQTDMASGSGGANTDGSSYAASSTYPHHQEAGYQSDRGRDKKQGKGRGRGNGWGRGNRGRDHGNGRHYYPEHHDSSQTNYYNGDQYYHHDNHHYNSNVGRKSRGRGGPKYADYSSRQNYNQIGNGDGNSQDFYSDKGHVFERGGKYGNKKRAEQQARRNDDVSTPDGVSAVSDYVPEQVDLKRVSGTKGFDSEKNRKSTTVAFANSEGPGRKQRHYGEGTGVNVINGEKTNSAERQDRDPQTYELKQQYQKRKNKSIPSSARGGRDFGRGGTRSKTSFNGRTDDSRPNDESQRGSLTDQLSQNKYECMVCCDIVRVDDAIWSCQQCYHVFHLSCVKKWAHSSMQRETKSWRCPGCQNVTDHVPYQYRCFCGRRRDPAYIRGETPHSCGETCKKRRKGNCKHPCTILCHPGPCPPCSAMVWQSCDCGQDRKHIRCSTAQAYQCDKVCKKPLNCSEHTCDQICHTGPCAPCSVSKQQECFCTKTSRTVLCGTENFKMVSFSCEKPCGRTLSCGNHTCEELCHPGECAPCPLMPGQLTTCNCGKMPIAQLKAAERKSCLDPVPTCEKPCELPLGCPVKDGPPHLCDKICHEGECGPCKKKTRLRCVCGGVEKEMDCSVAMTYTAVDPFKCQRRCGKKKSCGKHKCLDTCCVKDFHICDLVCGKNLACMNHRCEELCHPGYCKRCLQASFDELTCYCGAEVLEPPVPCGTKLPECHRPCTRDHACSHPVRHNCHADERCPPCTELTERMCMGGHMMRKNVPCHMTNISCGYPCQKMLFCGKHKCLRTCHKDSCLKAGAPCPQLCTKPRPACGHPCNEPCHEGECPDTQCKAEMTILCPCGNRSGRVICSLGGGQTSEIEQFQRLSVLSVAESGGGRSVDMAQFSQQKKNQRRLECDANCSVLERNRRLAEALEVDDPDLEVEKPKYSDFLKDFAKKNLQYCMSVEKTLNELVLASKESSQATKSHSFPPMKKEHRHFIHELSEMYGCRTQSFDKEPNKNVVTTALKERSVLPSVLLSQSLSQNPSSAAAAAAAAAATPPPISSLKTQGVRFKVLDTKKTSLEESSGSGKGGLNPWGRKEPAKEEAAAPNRGWEQTGAKAKPAPSIDYFDFTTN